LGIGRHYTGHLPNPDVRDSLHLRGFRLCGQALPDAVSRVDERSVVDRRRRGGVVLARGGNEIALILPQRFDLARFDAALGSYDL
jgi:hypothetical protein